MAKGNRGGQRGTTTGAVGGGTPTPSVQPAQSQPANVAYGTMTKRDAKALSKKYESKWGKTEQRASKLYRSNTNYDGQGHSLSQTLNFNLEQGNALSNKEQTVDRDIQGAMHPLDGDYTLYRGAHRDLINEILKGIGKPQDYQKFSGRELRKLLKGVTGNTTSYMSTSYDAKASPFIGGKAAGGRELLIEIKAKASTQCILGQYSQTEVVLNKGTNFRVTDVHYTHTKVTPRLGGVAKQVIMTLEVW